MSIAPSRSPAVRRWIPVAVAVAAVALWSGLDVHRSLPGHHDVSTATGMIGMPVSFSILTVGILVVMGPCVLQMGMVLTALWSGVPPSQVGTTAQTRVFAPAVQFLLGYGATIGALVALIILAGHFWPGWRLWLGTIAGLTLAITGVRLLRPGLAAHTCHGPGAFLQRYSGWHPAGMGVAYAAYCATCCGPYLTGLSLLLAHRGLEGGAVAGAFMLLLIMGIPVLAPVLFHTTGLVRLLARHQQALQQASGIFLAGVGVYLALFANVLP